MTNIYGETARAFDAKELLVITIRLKLKTKYMPASLIPSNRFVDISMISSDDFSGLILDNPFSLWICDRSLQPGEHMALVQSPEIGHELDK